MSIFAYHGKGVETLIYLTINVLLPKISYAFTGLDISVRFYIGIGLSVFVLALNISRAALGGYLRLIYGATIIANTISFVFAGMISYIGAILIIPYLL